MENSAMGLPPGFKFVPTDDEIIRFFLTNKIHGRQFHWLGIMPEFDLYGERGPWELLRTDEYPVYVFAMSKNISKERKQRTCDFGTWKLQKNDEDIVYGGQVIGSKALLTFMPSAKKVEDIELGGSWHMSEYSLPDSKDKECIVVCKVSFKSFDDEDKQSNNKRSRPEMTTKQGPKTKNDASKKKAKLISSNKQIEQFSNAVDIPHSSSKIKSEQVEEFSRVSEEPSSSTIRTMENMIQGGGGAELVQQTIDEVRNQDWCLDISELQLTFDEVLYWDQSKDNAENGAGLDPFYNSVVVEPDFAPNLNQNQPQPSTGTTFTDIMIQATTGWDADSCDELENLLKSFSD